MSRVQMPVLIAEDDDAVANLVERRWFAASTAVKAMQGECEVLREVMDLAEDALRHARAQLAELKFVRDALGHQLADLDVGQRQSHQPTDGRLARSAA
jgi:hypothetical protein